MSSLERVSSQSYISSYSSHPSSKMISSCYSQAMVSTQMLSQLLDTKGKVQLSERASKQFYRQIKNASTFLEACSLIESRNCSLTEYLRTALLSVSIHGNDPESLFWQKKRLFDLIPEKERTIQNTNALMQAASLARRFEVVSELFWKEQPARADKHSYTIFIHSASRAGQYEQILRAIEFLPASLCLEVEIMNAVIAAAIQNGDRDLARRIFHGAVERNIADRVTISSYFQSVKKEEDLQELEAIFQAKKAGNPYMYAIYIECMSACDQFERASSAYREAISSELINAVICTVYMRAAALRHQYKLVFDICKQAFDLKVADVKLCTKCVQILGQAGLFDEVRTIYDLVEQAGIIDELFTATTIKVAGKNKFEDAQNIFFRMVDRGCASERIRRAYAQAATSHSRWDQVNKLSDLHENLDELGDSFQKVALAQRFERKAPLVYARHFRKLREQEYWREYERFFAEACQRGSLSSGMFNDYLSQFGTWRDINRMQQLFEWGKDRGVANQASYAIYMRALMNRRMDEEAEKVFVEGHLAVPEKLCDGVFMLDVRGLSYRIAYFVLERFALHPNRPDTFGVIVGKDNDALIEYLKERVDKGLPGWIDKRSPNGEALLLTTKQSSCVVG